MIAFALIHVSCPAATTVLFEDTFSGDLSLWTGKGGGPHHGQIVNDPLNRTNRVLNFTALNVSGDIFTSNVINVAGIDQTQAAFGSRSISLIDEWPPALARKHSRSRSGLQLP